VAARVARGEDGEPYLSWHEAVEGHEQPGDGEGRQQLGELGGGAFGARRKGMEAGLSSAVERLRCGGGDLYRVGRWWRGGEAVVGGNGVSMLRPFRAMGRRAPISRVKGERRR
jgi:hypothetical protein